MDRPIDGGKATTGFRAEGVAGTYVEARVPVGNEPGARSGPAQQTRGYWTGPKAARGIRVAFAIVAANVALLALLPMDWIRPVIGLSIVWRVAVALLLIAPASLCLGFFFPLGIERVYRYAPPLVGWAFGVNGAVSVSAIVGASLATLHWGFTPVLAGVCGIYLVAALVFGKIPEMVGGETQ